jgi:hypothetical protein
LCLSSTKLVIKAEQDLPETEGGKKEGEQWEEMTQTMYAHMNK